MKILYGVQATGNGHITRARAMAPELARQGIAVDYLFTGRPADQLFDMAPFGAYRVGHGLSFCVRNGRMQYWDTLRQAKLRRCFQESQALDTRQYDLVLSDFEPVSAWAARRQGTPSIGIGHQYAFAHPVPKAGRQPVAEAILRWFAPTQLALGSHWHHFNSPILPPIIHTDATHSAMPHADPRQVLVYLPFEDTHRMVAMLRSIEEYQFHLFCSDKTPGQYGSVHVHPFGRESFQARLRQCPSVICNAGFELVSESLHLGKRILVKPIDGQMEQASNALALKRLSLASACNRLEPDGIRHFLTYGERVQVSYPNVARALAEWLKAGNWSDPDALSVELWSEMDEVQWMADQPMPMRHPAAV